MKEADLGDLETRGFVLVPGFLCDHELQVCREDYASQPVNEGNRNYSLSPVSGRAHDTIRERVREVLALVAAQTSLRVDLPLGGVYFAIARGISPAWHQDHESYFSIQNHHDYLNFYIPVVKPRRDKSNLSIVPFDALERASPRTFRKVVGGGAASFRALRGRTLVFFDDTGSLHLMPQAIDRIAYVPELGAGDLLLLRGDMIHSPQDTATERVALSFRAASSETLVHRSGLARGGPIKAWMMMNDPHTYERMFRAFDVAGKPALALAELQQTIGSLPESAAMGRKRFLRYLLRQKRRERVLLRFVGSTLTTAMGILALAVAGEARPRRPEDKSRRGPSFGAGTI